MTDILTVAGDLLSALLQLVTLGATGVAVVVLWWAWKKGNFKPRPDVAKA